MTNNIRLNAANDGGAGRPFQRQDILMPNEKLNAFLKENGVDYISIRHDPAFSAQAAAESAHFTGKGLAKTVIVKVDNELAMVVLPASDRVDLYAVSAAADGAGVVIADEAEFSERFPGCEPGAIPPFGNLFDMLIFLSPKLAEEAEIAFNAGSHTELIRMRFDDFERLTGTATIKLTEQPSIQ